MNDQNKIVEVDGRGTSVSFQGQNIKVGAFLYCFKFNAVIRVTGVEDCGLNICILYTFKRADYATPISDKNFCTLPSLEEADNERERMDGAISTGTTYVMIQLWKGIANENPLIDNLIASDSVKNVVRYACIVNADADGFTISSRFIIAKFKNGLANTQAVIGLGAWLHVFFTGRVKELSKGKEEAKGNIRIKKAIEFILEKIYHSEFVMTKKKKFQHKNGVNFEQWLKDNDLI